MPKHIFEKETDVNTSRLRRHPGRHRPLQVGRARSRRPHHAHRQPHFYGEGPYVETIVFKYIPDLTVLYTQFQTGDIDYIGLQGITPDHYDEAKKLADRVVTPVPQPFIENIAFNTRQARVQGQGRARGAVLRDGQEEHHRAIYYGLPTPTESYLPTRPGPSIPTCPSRATTPRRRRRSSTTPAGSPAPTASA